MPAYVALLRGIAPTNPKMHNAELRKVFEALSLEDVRTVISSGNVLFSTDERSAPKLENRIEDALHDHLGAPCSTILRSKGQIARLLRSDLFDPYDDGPTERCNVTFLKRRPPVSTKPPESGTGYAILAVRSQAVFSVVDTTTTGSPELMARVEKAYGPKNTTTRTWRTVHRIAAALDR